MKNNSTPNPNAKSRLSVTLPQSMLDQLEEVSSARGLSKSILLTLAWQDYVGQEFGISRTGDLDVKKKHE